MSNEDQDKKKKKKKKPTYAVTVQSPDDNTITWGHFESASPFFSFCVGDVIDGENWGEVDHSTLARITSVRHRIAENDKEIIHSLIIETTAIEVEAVRGKVGLRYT